MTFISNDKSYREKVIIKWVIVKSCVSQKADACL
nr:MAG TPA: hypothetical protein [Herelleviridae sp.]